MDENHIIFMFVIRFSLHITYGLGLGQLLAKQSPIWVSIDSEVQSFPVSKTMETIATII